MLLLSIKGSAVRLVSCIILLCPIIKGNIHKVFSMRFCLTVFIDSEALHLSLNAYVWIKTFESIRRICVSD